MTRVISVPSLLIGLGAGLASALLFAALVGGSVLALPLFLLAPLPIAIAAFGWGTPSGIVASATSLAAVGLGLGLPATIAMALADVAPVMIGAHLLGLARLSDPNDPAGREWYPLGRVLVALSIVVMVATIAGGVAIGFDIEETTQQVVGAYRQMMAMSRGAQGQTIDVAQLEPYVRGTVRLMPAFFPASWLIVVVFDLWAAAKVVAKSGRLARLGDDLAAVELPTAAGLVFAAALASAFVLDGPIGTLAAVIAGTLFSAHLLVGLGIVHTIARRSEARIILLATVYGLVLLFTLPAALIALAGLLDPHLGLRRRFGAGRPS